MSDEFEFVLVVSSRLAPVPRCALCRHQMDGLGDMCSFGWCRCVCAAASPAVAIIENVKESDTTPPAGDSAI